MPRVALALALLLAANVQHSASDRMPIHALHDVVNLIAGSDAPARTPEKECHHFMSTRCDFSIKGAKCSECTAKIPKAEFPFHHCTPAFRMDFCSKERAPDLTIRNCTDLLEQKCGISSNANCFGCLYRLSLHDLAKYRCSGREYRAFCAPSNAEIKTIDKLDTKFQAMPKMNFAPTPFTVDIGLKPMARSDYPCGVISVRMYCLENLLASVKFLQTVQYHKASQSCFPLLDRHATECKLKEEAVHHLALTAGTASNFLRQKSELETTCWRVSANSHHPQLVV